MKIEDNLFLTQLFEAYGPLLTKSQQNVLNDYLIYNLTGSEIAENRGITRQAVKDAITKAEKKLEEYESKLKFVEKMTKIKR